MESFRQCQRDGLSLCGGFHILEHLVAISGSHLKQVQLSWLDGLVEREDDGALLDFC